MVQKHDPSLQKTKSRIQAAEMRVLRLVRVVTRRDRIRNINIRRMLGIQPLLDGIEKSKLRWYGHVKRMNEERLPRKYLDCQQAGKRTVGWSRKRWKEGVDEALRRRGTIAWEVEEGRDFDDRDGWRQLLMMLPSDRYITVLSNRRMVRKKGEKFTTFIYKFKIFQFDGAIKSVLTDITIMRPW